MIPFDEDQSSVSFRYRLRKMLRENYEELSVKERNKIVKALNE